MNTHDSIAVMMAVEAALRAGGVPHEAASQVGRPQAGGCITLPIEADGYAIIGLDLIIRRDGSLALCEANGSNQAASSFGAPDGDTARAAHQVAAARVRIQGASRGVILIAYARGTGAVAEVISRAALVCSEIRRLKPCVLVDAASPLGDGLAVVVDSVENIAEHVSLRNGGLLYRGVEVLSAANPNLLPALVRRGVVHRSGSHYCVDTTSFHDGPFVDLVHDKHAQQRVAVGTGITPLACKECRDVENCLVAIQDFQARGITCVAKMNGGSGGCGIEFFAPTHSITEVRRRLDDLRIAAEGKYTGDIDQSLWPIRVFEFAESTGYVVGNSRHLWDVRVLALISPGKVDLTFCGIRLCPAPFTGVLDKASVLSNVTGRLPDLATTRSPVVEFGAPTAHLRSGGVDEEMLERLALACAHWCEAAWRTYATPIVRSQTGVLF